MKSGEVLIPSNHSYSLFLGTEVLVLNDHFLGFFSYFLSVMTSDEVLIPGQLPYSLVSW